MTGTVRRRHDLVQDLEAAHDRAVAAATAGLQDPALGALRLAGTAVKALADAAVSSATPFLRAPLLSRIGGALQLHPSEGTAEWCPTCGVRAPCETALRLRH
jgi:hypothetical protein